MKPRSALFLIAFLTLFLAGISLYVFSPSETQAASATFTVAGSASLAQVTQGGTVGLSVTVKNNLTNRQTTDVVFTLTDPAGKAIYSKTWAAQNFAAGQTLTFSTAYPTAANATPGKYLLGVKLQTSTSSNLRSTRTTVYYTNAALTGFSVAAPAAAVAPAPAPAPASASSIYWGVYMDGVPWDMPKLSAFESSVNKGASIVHFGQPWMHNGAYYYFPTSVMETVRLHGSIPMINWGSWDYSGGAIQSAWSLANVYNGTYDAFIQQYAIGAKAWNHPFFMRFDHEMNGWWQFPWAEQINGNQPGDYVKAWKHVHDIFTQVGATNVTWVWAPNVISSKTTPLASLYPGDAYVDWVAIDGYNWGTDHGNAWQSFSQVFTATYNALTQLAPGKPIMLAETSSSENGGSKADWIKDALQTQLPLNFPMIKALVWFNWNAGDSTLSWPVDSSLTSLAAFKSAMGSSYYAANTFTSLSPQVIKALP